MKHITATIVTMLLALAVMAAPAAAHGKDVHPPGQGDGHELTTVSRAWAQAHCHAAAPAKATASSGGVVVFTPDGPRPCGGDPNPGGRVHP